MKIFLYTKGARISPESKKQMLAEGILPVFTADLEAVQIIEVPDEEAANRALYAALDAIREDFSDSVKNKFARLYTERSLKAAGLSS